MRQTFCISYRSNSCRDMVRPETEREGKVELLLGRLAWRRRQMNYLTSDSDCWNSFCYRMMTRMTEREQWERNMQQVWQQASCAMWCIGLVWSLWCLQLTQAGRVRWASMLLSWTLWTSTRWDHGWFSSSSSSVKEPASHSATQFLINVCLCPSGRLLCYPFPFTQLRCNLFQWDVLAVLNRHPVTHVLLLPRLTDRCLSPICLRANVVH